MSSTMSLKLNFITFSYLATCSADTTVKIWSISPSHDFKHERSLVGHQRWVWDCAFSADSAYLVTGNVLAKYEPPISFFFLIASSDHTARLCEMASGETVRQYNGHHKGLDFRNRVSPCISLSPLPAAVCVALHDGAS